MDKIRDAPYKLLTDFPPCVKWCYACKEYMNIEHFGKNRRKQDGYATECRACKKIADAKSYQKHRARRLQRMKEYKEEHYEEIRIKDIETSRSKRGRKRNRVATKKYYNTHKEIVGKRVKEGYVKYPEKYRSRTAFRNACKCGKIQRPKECQQCFIECTPDGHHEDYSKPFEVVWLCKGCHGKMHRREVI